MTIKDNIRRRRQERIVNLLNRSEQARIEPVTSDRSDDPEYVWKMRHQQWQRELDHNDHAESHLDMSQHRPMFWRQLRYQFAFAMLAFLLIWGMFQLDQPWAQKGQAFIDRALTQPFEFETISQWYNQFFQGNPSFIPAFDREAEAEKVNAFD